MQAIILAAGQGRRLRDPRGRPKCLREVGGLPLVHHQIRALNAFGVDDVSIVVGYQQQQIRSCVGSAAGYVVNPRYAETNSMYSFLLAGKIIHDDLIVMNSDLFFHPSLVRRLLEPGDDALLYDSGSGQEAEQMKVRVAGDRLVEMSKVMSSDRVSGENVGILSLSLPTAQQAIRAASTIAARGFERAWLASAINKIAPAHPIRCLDVAGAPWVEIDFPEDLERARVEVLPGVATFDDELVGSQRASGGFS
ncbi:MAG: phosphocholine cytidylyltransferase family protein [Nocardioides sp.]